MVCTLSATFPLKILYPTTPWSLQPSLPLIPRFPTSSSLSVNPSGPSSTCIRKLSLTPTRNLLDCLDPATLPFHQMSGDQVLRTRLSQAVQRKLRLLFHLVTSSATNSYRAVTLTPLILTHRLSNQAAVHPREVPRTQPAPSPVGQQHLPIIFPSSPFCRACSCPSLQFSRVSCPTTSQ